MTAALVSILSAHRQQMAAFRARTDAAMRDAWRRVGYYDEQHLGDWLDESGPLVDAARSHSADMASAYLGEMLAEGGVDAPAAPAGEVVVRGGLELAAVYRRPLETVWWALGQGRAPADAVKAGEDKAARLALDDIQMSFRGAAQQVLADAGPKVVGYRRVIESGNPCDRCLLASTQRYHVGDLMPIHSNCSCSVAPIIGASDPGRVVNADLLGDLKSRGVSVPRDGRRPTVADDAEYGPLLEAA